MNDLDFWLSGKDSDGPKTETEKPADPVKAKTTKMPELSSDEEEAKVKCFTFSIE